MTLSIYYIYVYIYIHLYTFIYREREQERVKHELRGIELVRTIISQLVSAVAFFKGIF